MSATFIVKGRFAYGWLRSEQGVHRLVRMSPFDAAARRQTSFASMDVTPLYEDTSVTWCSRRRTCGSTPTAAPAPVASTSTSPTRRCASPTCPPASCRAARTSAASCRTRRGHAGARLEAGEKQRADRLAELTAISGTTSSAAMGNQIRSYVQAPYQLVKDLRTGHETGNVEAVIENGDLDGFMEAFLRDERAAAASR
jgi:peptide chain release factor 2